MFFKNFRSKNGQNNQNNNTKSGQNSSEINETRISIEALKRILGVSIDVVFRELDIQNVQVTIIYVDGMVDYNRISEFIIKPLKQKPFTDIAAESDAFKLIQKGYVYNASQSERTNLADLIDDILSGSTAIVFKNEASAFTFETKGFEKRAVTEPSNENVIKGSKDSFVEILSTNTALCRMKIRSHDLVIEKTVVGKQSLTKIAIVYLKNIVNPHLVDEVKKRLQNINIDIAINTGFVEEFIIDKTLTPFPMVIYTERVDKFCNNLADGRVGILIDSLPVAFILPATLMMFIQAPEDYSQNFLFSSLKRFLRYLSFIITLTLPAFYVSVATFHHEMIPTELAISIATSKQGVPFPMFFEVLGMLVAFELLIEAGFQLPRAIGQAMSIVGALIVGQAAVQAKLLSPATVIAISATAVCGFTMPNQDLANALRLWRLILVIMASIIGFYGLALGFIIILYQLSKIETFGVPYLDPFVANDEKQLQDTLFRLPLKLHKKRPLSLKTINKKRMGGK